MILLAIPAPLQSTKMSADDPARARLFAQVPELKQLENVVTCPICYEVATHPTVTPCHHLFCSLCIRYVCVLFILVFNTEDVPLLESSCSSSSCVHAVTKNCMKVLSDLTRLVRS